MRVSDCGGFKVRTLTRTTKNMQVDHKKFEGEELGRLFSLMTSETGKSAQKPRVTSARARYVEVATGGPDRSWYRQPQRVQQQLRTSVWGVRAAGRRGGGADAAAGGAPSGAAAVMKGWAKITLRVRGRASVWHVRGAVVNNERSPRTPSTITRAPAASAPAAAVEVADNAGALGGAVIAAGVVYAARTPKDEIKAHLYTVCLLSKAVPLLRVGLNDALDLVPSACVCSKKKKESHDPQKGNMPTAALQENRRRSQQHRKTDTFMSSNVLPATTDRDVSAKRTRGNVAGARDGGLSQSVHSRSGMGSAPNME
ncbi:hypothetical protein EVAR_31518_1 [Eumeta japonica]|uniref:Uncharacterized protein n=1 Tax=Eumeta variegata TaxID=151549 RepID=A0A4C1YY11_EUMVA|nr:hypothetical protein EVAR_31518_1 [Eumeta japonica]